MGRPYCGIFWGFFKAFSVGSVDRVIYRNYIVNRRFFLFTLGWPHKLQVIAVLSTHPVPLEAASDLPAHQHPSFAEGAITLAHLQHLAHATWPAVLLRQQRTMRDSVT